MMLRTTLRPLFAVAILIVAATPGRAQSASADWRTDVPCTAGRNAALVVADSPRAAAGPGCVQAYCTTTADGRRVCACRGDTTTTMRVEAEGRLVREWPASFTFVGEELFTATHGDLDGDGRAELIVGQFVTASNGIGIEYFDLTIFDGRDPARAPVRLRVEDYDPRGAFVRPRRGGACRLIATHWEWLRDQRRGPGLYFTGQWMEYRDGRLLHDASRPVVVRRLLHSFRHHDPIPGKPFAHLRDPRARAWTRFPADLPPLDGSRIEGSILRVKADTVDFAATPHRILVLSGFGEPTYDEGGATTTWWLVDGATGRPYPAGYAPADPRWLQGTPAYLSSYQDEGRRVNLLVVRENPSTTSGSR
ncbi:MAG TPA: hypothetical protein VFR37_09080 [Longimicrobium sp.]|nr:hypothetical protein [Longimicrobium sp.]